MTLMRTNDVARQIAGILLGLDPRVNVERVLEKAERIAARERDLAVARVDWPKFNAEVAAGEVEGIDATAAPMTFRAYLEWCRDNGEWKWDVVDE
jgi:hypothetical protein